MPSIHPQQSRTRSSRGRIRVATVLCAATCVLWAASACAGALYHALDRPDRAGPPLITLGPTFGGAPDWAKYRFGFSGAILLRPDAAANLCAPLYYWNTGLVIQGEYRDIAPDRNLLAADLVVRRYFVDGRRRGRSAVLFAGAGGGLALVAYPVTVASGDAEGEEEAEDAPAETRRGEQRYYSFLAELGYEREVAANVVLIWKAQWRSYIWSSRDYSNWSLHAQIGFPLPW